MRWPIGGRRLSEAERDQIRRLYLSGLKNEANELAATYGLSDWYAYKLANQSGQLPSKREARDRA